MASATEQNSMLNPDVIISGGGIGGLTLALTLHQIGVTCRVVEASVNDAAPRCWNKYTAKRGAGVI